jgi:hypothetical protein
MGALLQPSLVKHNYARSLAKDIVDGKLIGAVGVSGGSVEQDSQVAKAGADAAK